MLTLLFMAFLIQETDTKLNEEFVQKGFPILKAELNQYWRELAENEFQFDYPRMVPYQGSGLRQEQIGRFYKNLGWVGERGNTVSCFPKIRQIFGAEECLVAIMHDYQQNSFTGGAARRFETLVVVRGMPTEDLATDQSPEWFDQSFIVNGTMTYPTVAGGKNTVPVLTKTDLEDLPTHRAMVGVDLREWSDSTGKFSTTAAYDKFERGSVHMTTNKGKELVVPLDKLDKDSQEFVREQIKIEREKAKEAERQERLKRKD